MIHQEWPQDGTSCYTKAVKNTSPVSIIIPTLNEEDYIGNLLASLIAQSYQNFEVIIVDGKSKDNTIKTCERFKTLLPSLTIISSNNKSVSLQRNLGAQKAKFEQLLFLDADIILPANFLSIALEEIKKEKAGIATCYSWPLSSKILDYTLYLIQNVGTDIARHILPAIFGWTIFTSKKLHTKIKGFNAKMHFAEDQDYVQKAVKNKAKFLILKNTSPYVSIRRFDYESRFSMMKKGILYGILAGAYGKEEAQKFITHECGDYEKIKQGIKLSAKKAGLSRNAVSELHDFFNPIVKYPLQGSRLVFNSAKSVVVHINKTIDKILET